jgi:8-oxo-dGTP pyrophosphatase MutT (NUDIX family)
MGAGILPSCIHNGKLYFLFGKENKYEKSAPGFSDFGGGSENNESYLDTAIREAGEELTGFLGNDNEIKDLLKKNGTYNIDFKSNNTNKIYRMHIFSYLYNPWLTFYYNNNQKFLQQHLSEEVFKTTKIFEKAEIKWICIDELKEMRSQFRSYFQNIIDLIIKEKILIENFVKKSQNKLIKGKTKFKNKIKNKKTRKLNIK